MPKGRKTIAVEDVQVAANTYLRESHEDQDGERYGVASLLERVLHDTGNYHGFRYTDGARGEMDASRRFYF